MSYKRYKEKMKTKDKRNYLKQSGITLIALVVTIVVLLILTGVSINAIFGQDGIIQKAKDSQNKMNQATQNDLDSINSLNEWIDGKINGTTGGESEAVTNPYDPNGWTMAYVCNDGTWSDTPLTAANGDTIPEGTQIVAKFYKTGKNIAPEPLKFMGETLASFSEGEEYKVIIEGSGKMGTLMSSNQDVGYAWQSKTPLYLEWTSNKKEGNEVSDIAPDIIIPYITEVTITDGITDVNEYAFFGGTSISKVLLPNTITSIEEGAFCFCSKLENVTIPNSVISIKQASFTGCISLTNITIPGSVREITGKKEVREDGVSYTLGTFACCINLKDVTIEEGIEKIGHGAFQGCTSLINITIPSSVTSIGDNVFNKFVDDAMLAKVKILATDANRLEVGSSAFSNLSSNSKIYVLSEEIKAKLEGSYDTSKTTVEVVTLEQMNNL